MSVLKTFIKRKGGDDAEMSFLEHLEELRWHIVRSLIAIVIVGFVIAIKTTWVFDHVILAPSHPEFFTFQIMCKLADVLHMSGLCVPDFHVLISNIDMSGQFMLMLRNAFSLGLVLVFPYLLYELWRFLSPALYEHERNQVTGVVFMGSVLFYIGLLFGYYLIAPFTVYFLGTFQVSEQIENHITLTSYVDTISGLCFACGLVFEFPLVIYLLARIGLATHTLLSKYRRWALVGILFIAAIITPSPDMFSQTLVAIPLYGLFEVGIIVSRRVTHRREAKQRREEEEYERSKSK